MLKALELQKLSNKSSLKEPGGELEAKNCFQKQSWTKYMRQTLAFMCSSALQEKFNFYFSGVFLSIDKTFIFEGTLRL